MTNVIADGQLSADDIDRAAVVRDRSRQAEQSRKRYAIAAEINKIPPIQNKARREFCRKDLLLFLMTYFPNSTGLSLFGDAQVKVINRIEHAILHDGRILNCMPRGYVKSTISENAILWAVLYGHRRYGVVFGATGDEANAAISSIKTELSENEDLFQDFPEVCHPIRLMEGKPQKCVSQTFNGVSTYMQWTAETIVLPTIPGSVASGAIIRTKGYTSAARGMRYKRPDGVQARPDLIVLDDTQTEAVAISPSQVAKHLSTLHKSIMRTGGHGAKPTAIMNATCIQDGDAVDQLSDHRLYPAWQAAKVKMLPSMPSEKAMMHWEGPYTTTRNAYDEDVVGDQQRAHLAATEYYRQHQEEMDEGAEASWNNIPLEDGEISAIQHAMNIKIDDGDAVFASECQNEPIKQLSGPDAELTLDELKERTNGFAQYVVPAKSTQIVFHIDVHDTVLFYTVVAVDNQFSGWIIDYGTFPEQPQTYFTVPNASRTLKAVIGTANVEEAISQGVKLLVNSLCDREWKTPDGTVRHVCCGLIDVGYRPEQVAQGARMSDHARILFGCRGIGIGPIKKSMTEWDTSPARCQFAGPDPRRPRWVIANETVDGLKVVQHDSYYFKSLTASRLSQNRNVPGEWSLYGNHTVDHTPVIQHYLAEEPVKMTAMGRTVTVWRTLNDNNHWFDTVVGCSVAATIMGIQPPGSSVVAPVAPKSPPPQQPSPPQQPKIKMKPIGNGGKPFFISARR